MLRRLVIPGALAAIVVGAAVGAAASYLASQEAPGARQAQGPRTAPAGPARPATQPATAAAGQGTTAATGMTTATGTTATGTTGGVTAPSSTSSAGVAEGRLLNDQAYAHIQRGEYGVAIPALERAVEDLRGAGPADPYEAYANYNLGYALLQVGDCADALPPLEVANRLESSPLVDIAIRRASACAHQGS